MIPGIVASQFRARVPPTLGAKYWRIRTSAVDGGAAMSLAEMRMYSAAAPDTNLIAPGGTAFGSPHYIDSLPSRYAPASAFDGNLETIFASQNGQVQSLGWQFQTAMQVDSIVIVARPDGGTYGQSPRDFTVESSNDGSTWSTEWTVSGSVGWTSGESRRFSR